MYTQQDAIGEIKNAVVSGANDAEAVAEAIKLREREDAKVRASTIAAQLTRLLNSAIEENIDTLDPAGLGQPITAFQTGETCTVAWKGGYAVRIHSYQTDVSRYEIEQTIQMVAANNGHDLTKFAYVSGDDADAVGYISRCRSCRQMVAYNRSNPLDITGDFYEHPCLNAKPFTAN